MPYPELFWSWYTGLGSKTQDPKISKLLIPSVSFCCRATWAMFWAALRLPSCTMVFLLATLIEKLLDRALAWYETRVSTWHSDISWSWDPPIYKRVKVEFSQFSQKSGEFRYFSMKEGVGYHFSSWLTFYHVIFLCMVLMCVCNLHYFYQSLVFYQT